MFFLLPTNSTSRPKPTTCRSVSQYWLTSCLWLSALSPQVPTGSEWIRCFIFKKLNNTLKQLLTVVLTDTDADTWCLQFCCIAKTEKQRATVNCVTVVLKQAWSPEGLTIHLCPCFAFLHLQKHKPRPRGRTLQFQLSQVSLQQSSWAWRLTGKVTAKRTMGDHPTGLMFSTCPERHLLFVQLKVEAANL